MADTTFTNGVTLTDADWFNDLNRLHYTIFGDPADIAAVRTALAISSVPSGTIIDFGGSAAPTGYLACDGSAVNRVTYAALFSAIGTLWGAGDGVTTFNLPSFTPGEAAVQSAGTVGASTDGQMPAHTHGAGSFVTQMGDNYTGAGPYIGSSGILTSGYTQGPGVNPATSGTSGSAGSGTRNYAAGKRVYKCIKT